MARHSGKLHLAPAPQRSIKRLMRPLWCIRVNSVRLYFVPERKKMIAIRPDQLHRCQPVSLFYFCNWQQRGTLWLQEISARSRRCTHLKGCDANPPPVMHFSAQKTAPCRQSSAGVHAGNQTVEYRRDRDFPKIIYLARNFCKIPK